MGSKTAPPGSWLPNDTAGSWSRGTRTWWPEPNADVVPHSIAAEAVQMFVTRHNVGDIAARALLKASAEV